MADEAIMWARAMPTAVAVPLKAFGTESGSAPYLAKARVGAKCVDTFSRARITWLLGKRI